MPGRDCNLANIIFKKATKGVSLRADGEVGIITRVGVGGWGDTAGLTVCQTTHPTGRVNIKRIYHYKGAYPPDLFPLFVMQYLGISNKFVDNPALI